MTREEQRAGDHGAEAEAAVAGRLGEVVADRGAERTGEDVGDPEAPAPRPGPSAKCAMATAAIGQGEQHRGEPVAEVHALGDQIAGRGAEGEGEQDGEPVEGLAAGGVDAWMDRVRSRRYQTAKTTARTIAKTVVLVSSGTPSCR